ncbi:MAG: hypothetical protein EAZ06_11420 [Cytophagales bacterium]|nr:MAG: hypothetical protein EAZ06_11420 [Cytophagales bacterium]
MCSGQYTVGEVTIGFSVYYESTGSCWDSKSIVEGSAVGTMAIQNSKAGTISVELFADPSVCM